MSDQLLKQIFRFPVLTALLVSFISMGLKAQDEASPLIEKMLKTTGNGKIDLMNEISVVYRKTDKYTAMDYARRAYKLSVDANYLPGKALALKNEGICWFFVGGNDSAMICYKKALGIFAAIGDKTGMSACYNNVGLIAQETGKYEEALKYYQLSVDIDRKLGDEIGVAATIGNMADIHLYTGNAKKALVLTNQCIGIYTKHSYKPGLMSAYSNRAAEFDYLMQYAKSISDYTLALKFAIELNDRYQEIMANSNIGVTYWHMGKPDTAMSFLNKALEMSDETDDAYNIDNTLNTIAQIYTSQKHYVRANEILLKVLKRNEEIDNKRQAAVSMTAMGRNLLELNEIDKAMGYLTKSLEITSDLKAPYEMLENYRNLAHAHAILHNFATADSLLDLFAETYSGIAHSDSAIAIKSGNFGDSVENPGTSPSSGGWASAFLLLILIGMVSVLAFRGKSGPSNLKE